MGRRVIQSQAVFTSDSAMRFLKFKQALTIAGLVGVPRFHGPMAHDSRYSCDLAAHLQTLDTCRGRAI